MRQHECPFVQNYLKLADQLNKSPLEGRLSDLPKHVIDLLQRAMFWSNVEQTLSELYARKVFRPPKWVVKWYWTEFIRWAQKFEPPTDDKTAGSKKPRYEKAASGDFPWATWLGVSPRIDIWCGVENALYGRIVTELFREYEEGRKARREVI